jgi:hypothetical protein
VPTFQEAIELETPRGATGWCWRWLSHPLCC